MPDQTPPTPPGALLITRNLPPLVGGMERLVWHLVDALAQDYRVHVIGPAGCAAHLPTGVTANEIPITPLWRFLLRTKWQALLQAWRLRPKVILAGSGLTAPFAWLAARLVGARCVVYLHGLDIEAQHLAYRILWRPFFKRFDRVFVNSRFTRELALNAGVPEARLQILHPGVTLPDSSQAEPARADFRRRHQLGAQPVLLYVGRITARKGLLPFIRDIFPLILQTRPDTRLVVIGDEPKWALKQDNSLGAQIQHILKARGLTAQVDFLGERAQDDPELSAAYFAADALIFPVQNTPGDNEGFGMVAIEAAAHGLPTVAFNAGGVGDAVADGVSGRLVAAGDQAAFARAALDLLAQAPDSASVRRFAQQFAWPEFSAALTRGLNEASA
ncbi:glycosyltransferase family 4 protein [Halothiobacillus sp. DCM-1]|uniref:glycosyltransferase family 4 protein n=1 Tax=Halothiobacillus sp. DCM-1 TaxID=3112558 RepID=UPI00324DEDFC